MTAPAITIDEGHAAAELLRRRRARANLVDYARAIDIPGVAVNDADWEDEVFRPVESALALHHRVIMEAIQKCIETPRGRLIIQAPPGSAKSTYVSVVTPPWAMGKYPGYRVILASYATDLAVKQSRRARSVCKQDKHISIFPQAGLATDQKAAHEWKMPNESEFMAAGFEAGITGNRADLLLVDDPVKNRKDADSVTVRQTVADEFRDSAKTRLKPEASIIIIMTRWNEADLVGDILPENYAGESGEIACRDGQTWTIINIPAKCEHSDDPLGRQVGDYLWPEWFPREHWAMWENDPRAARTWSALFQQRPRPTEGLNFIRSNCRWYDPDAVPGSLPVIGTPGSGTEERPWGPPTVLRLYGASDYATLNDDGDFTEHGVAGMDPSGYMVFVDWWSGQKETDVSISEFIRLVTRWRRVKIAAAAIVRWWNEGGPIDKAIKPAINRAMRESPAGQGFVSCDVLPSISDKETKLLSFHARWGANMVVFPIRRDWAQKVVNQLLVFPAGKFDDKCDVCGLFGRGIDKMGNAALPLITERRKELVPFTGAWLEFNEPKAPEVRYW